MLAEKLMGIKTVYMDVEQLAEAIDQYFIQGADRQKLEEIRATIKGSFFFIRRYCKGNLQLEVSNYRIWYWPINSRYVWIYDKDKDTYYELKKGRWFKKLRKAVYERLDKAKAGVGIQNKIVCPKCGKENTPDSRFCEGCGAELQAVSKSI